MASPPAGSRWGWLVACVAGGLAPALGAPLAQGPSELGPSIDKVQIAGVVRELAARLSAADHLAADNHWQDAIDEYLDLLREHGDDLVPVAAGPLSSGQRFVQARWLVHQRIAASGPDAWKAFRKRTQQSAQQRLAGAEDRDPAKLRRVVEEAFCTPAAARALELLGDLAFERGDFAEAEHWWRLLAAPASAPPETGKLRPLLFPDPSDEVLAQVRAKQIVSMLFQEQAWRAHAELQAYRKAHAALVGDLAGQRGSYADIVQLLLTNRQGELPAVEHDWSTFGCDASRNGTVPYALSPRLWAEGPAWRVRLETGDKFPDTIAAKPEAGAESAQPPACHPLIVGSHAWVTDGRFVRGFALKTGRQIYQYDLLEGRDVPGLEERDGKGFVKGRHTLTAADGHLFVRLGAQGFGSHKVGTWLVCLRLPTAAEDKAPRQRWVVQTPPGEDEQTLYEGAPVVLGKSVYIVQSRCRGTQVRATLCCYHADRGTLSWEQDLVEAPQSSSPCGQPLLTQAGPLLVYCSHAGAVVAVEAATGKRAWAVRYASRPPRMPRPCSPPLAVGSSVVVAPSDLDRLLCLDAATGSRLWEREALEVSQILGVSHDLLVVATPTGIRALNLTTGDDRGGWSQPAVGMLRTWGQGLLAGDRIFWPTQDSKLPWRLLGVHDGAVTDDDPSTLRLLPAGNMAVGRGCLVIATSEELWGFTAPPALVGPPGDVNSP
jgi:outer membrane protein assembly factor BamB